VVCIVVLRLVRTSWSLVLSRGSSHVWTISFGEGTCPPMRFSRESSRREIEARVP